ncbi:uncharacterized protein TNCV_4533501 [Trichonephila clavipes]|nr:uncharacterized protein TNCV_4533501 [Trichonephila clavipes]
MNDAKLVSYTPLFTAVVLQAPALRSKGQFPNPVPGRHHETRTHRKCLIPDELANLLQELSENESNGGYLSCSNLNSDEDMRLSESDCQEYQESIEVIGTIPVKPDICIARDGLEWIPPNSNLPGRFSTRMCFATKQ